MPNYVKEPQLYMTGVVAAFGNKPQWLPKPSPGFAWCFIAIPPWYRVLRVTPEASRVCWGKERLRGRLELGGKSLACRLPSEI
ncbi:hypothetical protein TURU_057452 [Turdus rufiventris]|nr:hypothetical protein TURU_057452 [Turdus rufiventris]